jgi:glycerol-3-phosphate acyltransferase PlsY
MGYLLAYLIGSIPFSMYISNLYGFDVREHGSGNAGATNMFRVNKILGVITFLLDFLKGYLTPKLILSEYPNTNIQIVMIMIIMGHILPIFFNFKGGKGVATSFGTILYFDGYLFLVLVLNWLQNAYFTGIGFISTILSFGGLVVISVFYEKTLIMYTLWLFITIIITHKKNFLDLVNDESV